MCYHVSSSKCLLLAFLFCCILALPAQINISAPKNVCIGNLAYFDCSPSVGIKSYKWDFGDGFTSVSKAPFHLYKNMGSYTISLSLKLNNGTTVMDSVNMVVDGLPKAILLKDGPQDSCLYTNLFTIRDQSTPAKTGQDIVKRLILWGDGDFDNSSNRKFDDKLDHHYEKKDIYPIKMEITDNRGCKSSISTKVKVIDGTKAKIKVDISYPSCGEAEVCFSNQSLSSNGAMQVYIWNFDSSGFSILPYTQRTCFTTKSSKYVRAYLLLSNPDNTCRSEDYVKIYLDADSIKNQMNMSDTSICYGSQSPLELRNSGNNSYSYSWSLNGKSFLNEKDVNIIPKTYDLTPDTYLVECRVSKGPCSITHTGKFRVKGPVARMHLFNKKQCGVMNRVFFIDTSRFLNKKHALYNWTVTDPEGENCVIHRALDINKYKNCNISKDWFGKHDYTVPRKLNKITLEVTDTLAGCSDSTSEYAKHGCCGLCKRLGGPISICQYDKFIDLLEDEIGPKFFSLDTGKTWLKFPSEVPKPYKGLYGVAFIFENYIPDRAEDFGDDSIKIYRDDSTWMDTLFTPDFLYVREAKSTEMTVDVYNACKPYEAVITLKDSLFFAGDSTIIEWGDGQTDVFSYVKDTLIKTYKHLYRLPGLSSHIFLTFKSRESCTRNKTLKIQFGKQLELIDHGAPCKNNEICFEAIVTNTYNNSRLEKLKNITWKLDQQPTLIKLYKLCQTYKTGGKKMITLIAEDSLGCIDTIEHKFVIRELKAGVSDDSRTFYCSELKQLFDSSYHLIKDSTDYISRYFWDFGSGMYTTTEKDPFRSFDLRDSIVHITHIVIDNAGCQDSFTFDVKIIGSLPECSFIDTMGCSPFKVVFKNLSKKCSSYIWEFDDFDNTTFENHDENDVSFIYEKQGKFHPKLIGIDTFYNAYTGSVYYCHTTFDPGKSITVFKTIKSTLEGIDTICLGQVAEFTSLSEDVLFNHWDFGDGSKGDISIDSVRVKYLYTKAGNYKLTVVPVYKFLPGTPVCLDSNVIDITVLGVKADFEIDQKSDVPVFYFNNRSQPSYADLRWDFGHPASGSLNFSTKQNPRHNYGKDNGLFTVCLTASVLNKCRDTVCKPVHNDYTEKLVLYNVFTPGNNDGLNDEYEVTMVGENAYSLIIYDRWGVVVYRSDEDGEIGDGINWNGRVHNSGNLCPAGTYYYIFNYSFKMDPDKNYSVNGVITLIRK